MGTVLTSPTYYVSYKSVFASDGCTGIGPILYNTIVPIPGTEQLSSVFGGTLPCVAHVQNQFTQEWTATASFNVTDLIEPVPFSIYTSQPWCATYQFEHGCNTACPTTEAYKPIIVVPEVVLQNMDPAWESCYGDIRGVYDPPIALTQVASVNVPQMTDSVPAVSQAAGATPASAPSQPAAETSAAVVLPDNLPSHSVGGGQPQASRLSEHGQGVGGVVASLLGGAEYSQQAVASLASLAPQTGLSNVSPDHSPSNDAGGKGSPQGSRPSGSGPGQAVGGIVAGILGSAQPLNEAEESRSGHAPPDPSMHAGNSAPTLTSHSGDRSHHPSAATPEDGVTTQDSTIQGLQEYASADSRPPITPSGTQTSGMLASLLETSLAAISDNKSNTDKLISVSETIEDSSTSITTSTSNVLLSTSDSSKKEKARFLLKLAIVDLVVLYIF